MVTDGDRKLIYNAANDRYYYFDKMPEIENKYDPSLPEVQMLKEKLDAYRASEVIFTGEAKSAEKRTRRLEQPALSLSNGPRDAA